MVQVHKVALEMVCTVALERRLGFIDQNINLDIQTIMTSLEGYKVGVNKPLKMSSSEILS
jgi:hypothetical protein